MNALKIIFFGLLMVSLAACEKEDCGFEAEVQGTLYTTEARSCKGGTHYVGDTTLYGGHVVFVSSNPNINLDDYLGQDMVFQGNYLRKQDFYLPSLVDVVSVRPR